MTRYALRGLLRPHPTPMPTDKTSPDTRRRLRHVALDGAALSGPPGQQDHWTDLGDPEPVSAEAPRCPVRLATPPTPAVTRYARSGEVEPLLIGRANTLLEWPRSKLRRAHPRLTRIIKSLADLCVTAPDCGVSSTTRGYWRDALPAA